MVTFLRLAACLILAHLPQIASLRQMVHDGQFQPDYILRVTHQVASIACRTRLSALANGRSSFSRNKISLNHKSLLSFVFTFCLLEQEHHQDRRSIYGRTKPHGWGYTMIWTQRILRWYRESFSQWVQKVISLTNFSKALAWSKPICCSLLRWDTTGKSMAD
jgi:hypothetical protein